MINLVSTIFSHSGAEKNQGGKEYVFEPILLIIQKGQGNFACVISQEKLFVLVISNVKSSSVWIVKMLCMYKHFIVLTEFSEN